jgi:hypothetical protein
MRRPQFSGSVPLRRALWIGVFLAFFSSAIPVFENRLALSRRSLLSRKAIPTHSEIRAKGAIPALHPNLNQKFISYHYLRVSIEK